MWVGDFVRRHPLRGRSPRNLESGAKEHRSGCGIAMFSEQYFHDLSVLVEGAIDVAPAPRYFHIRFIHGPALAHRVPMRFRGLLIQRSKLLPPVEHGRRIHTDVSLGQLLDDICIAEAEA